MDSPIPEKKNTSAKEENTILDPEKTLSQLCTSEGSVLPKDVRVSGGFRACLEVCRNDVTSE